MVTLSRPLLPDFGNHGLENRGAIGVNCLAKMQTYKICKIFFNDGQEYWIRKYLKYILHDRQ